MNNELSDIEEKYIAAGDNVDQRIEVTKEYFYCLERKLKSSPTDAETLIRLGVLAWEPFHEQERAISYLQKALEIDPSSVDTRFWLAKCYYHDFCDYKNANRLLREALQIDPNRADCLCILTSVIEDTTKNLNEAIKLLEHAIQVKRDWPMLYICLIDLYLKVNNISAAQAQVLELEKLIPLPVLILPNAIERYYETIVTGRNYKNIKMKINEIKKEINKYKK